MINYDRTDCIKSYFDLVVLLNKGNKFVNEQTKASFSISDMKLFIGIDHRQKIYLCKYNDRYWKAGGFSGHHKLEFLICKILNAHKMSSGEIDELIKAELFKIP